jgi:hypothetical protein
MITRSRDEDRPDPEWGCGDAPAAREEAMRLVKFVDARVHEAVWVNPDDVTIVSSVKGQANQSSIYYGRDRLEVDGAPSEVVNRLLHPQAGEEL